MDRDDVFAYSLLLLLILCFTIIVGGQQPLLLSVQVK